MSAGLLRRVHSSGRLQTGSVQAGAGGRVTVRVTGAIPRLGAAAGPRAGARGRVPAPLGQGLCTHRVKAQPRAAGSGKALTSWGVPGSQLQTEPGQLGAAQAPEGPWAPASPPSGRDGGLEGAPLAERPVPGLGPHAAAFPGPEPPAPALRGGRPGPVGAGVAAPEPINRGHLL